MRWFEFLRSWKRKNRQTNRETKEKGKMLLLFKVGKGCVLDKGIKVIIEVVENSYKCSFITEVYFLFF